MATQLHGGATDDVDEKSVDSDSEVDAPAAARPPKRKNPSDGGAAAGSRKDKKKQKLRHKLNKKKKAKKGGADRPASSYFDVEAEQSSDEEVSADEEEGEGDNEYRVDGFVVDRGDDEEGSVVESSDDDSEDETRRRLTNDVEVDADDLDIARQGAGARVGAGGGGAAAAEPEEERVYAPRVTNRAELRDRIVGEDTASQPDDEEEEDDMDDDDDMDGFIVDEQGRPLRRNRRRARGQVRRLDNERLQSAISIFGDIFGPVATQKAAGVDESLLQTVLADAAPSLEDETAIDDEAKRRMDPLRAKFEPAQLQRFFFTVEDERIRMQDIPERLQVSMQGRKEMLERLLVESEDPADRKADLLRFREGEASWITSFLVFPDDTYPTDDSVGGVPGCVQRVLDFLYDEGYDIPFIWQYKRDYVPLLALHHLWTVLDKDQEYLHLQSSIELARTRAATIPHKPVRDGLRTFLQGSLIKADVTAALNLCNLLLHTKASDGDAYVVDDGQLEDMSRAVVANEPYKTCVRNNVQVLRDKFCITAQQLAGNMYSMKHASIMPDPVESPQQVAELFCTTNDAFTMADGTVDAQKALRAACFMAAIEISRHPIVVRYLRRWFTETATVSTEPTSMGKVEIDSFHRYYGLHTLQHKPVAAFGRFNFPDRPPPDREQDESDELNLKDDEYPPLALDLQPVAGDWHQGWGTERLSEESQDGGWLKEGGQESGCAREAARCGGPEQFCLLVEAEQQGFLTIHLDCRRQDIFNRCVKWFLSKTGLTRFDDASLSEWDRLRASVIQRVLDILIPDFVVELRRQLLQDSQTSIASSFARTLRRRALQGPFRPTDRLYDEDKTFVESPRVVCVYLSRDPTLADVAVGIDSDGNVVITKELPDGRQHPAFENAVDEVFQATRPHVVVVNTSSPRADKVARALSETCCDGFMNRFGRKRHHQVGVLSVLLQEDDVATIYATSDRSKSEFPNDNALVRAAVCMARYLQNPLCELCGLWATHGQTPIALQLKQEGVATVGDELLCLKLHPLQHLVPPAQLLKAAERVMCEAAAAVGVDIFLAARHPHVQSMLSFVPGLGPRKAGALLESIRSILGELSGREDLLKRAKMGETVYHNCAGFLRFTRAPGAGVDANAFDESRIHPMYYDIAKMILGNAYGDTADDPLHHLLERATKDTRAARKAMATAQAGWDLATGAEPRDKLAGLDLEAFAVELERQKRGKLRRVVQTIKMELRLPGVDIRRPFQPPQVPAVFRMLTGQHRDDFRDGIVVTGRVTYVADFFLKVIIYDNVVGMIPKANALEPPESDMRHFRLTERFSPDQVLQCRILRAQRDKLLVTCTCRPIDIMAAFPRVTVDKFCDRGAAELLEQAMREAVFVDPTDEASGYTRPIGHSSFSNVTREQAEAQLDARPLFDYIVRPSRLGTDHLTLTFKYGEHKFVHIDIVETEKDSERPKMLGRRLSIGPETFEDLDEIAARFVDPLARFYNQAYKFRKWCSLSPADLEAKLRSEKQVNPRSVPYVVCESTTNPGDLELAFISDTRLHRDRIGVKCRGYKYRNNVYSDLDLVCNEFKTRCQQPAAPPPVPSRHWHAPELGARQLPPPGSRMAHY